MNHATISGRLVDDPKTSEKGPARIRVEVRKRVKDKETQEFKFVPAGFFTVVAWGELKSRVATLAKGQLVMVGGRLETSSYEKDGQKRYETEIVADEVTVAIEAPVLAGGEDW